MRLLLDTHVLISWLATPDSIQKSTFESIADRENIVHVSALSIVEIAMNVEQGTLKLPADYLDDLGNDEFHSLSITFEHARQFAQLSSAPLNFFDRMIIAQAQVEKLTIVTGNRQVSQYDVSVLRP